MLSQLDQFNLHHAIAEFKAPTVVMFGSAACSSCRHLQHVLEQLAGNRPDWLVFMVDAQRDMALTREFEVFHLPAVFLFYQGVFHSEITCAASPKAIQAAIEDALQKPPTEAP